MRDGLRGPPPIDAPPSGSTSVERPGGTLLPAGLRDGWQNETGGDGRGDEREPNPGAHGRRLGLMTVKDLGSRAAARRSSYGAVRRRRCGSPRPPVRYVGGSTLLRHLFAPFAVAGSGRPPRPPPTSPTAPSSAPVSVVRIRGGGNGAPTARQQPPTPHGGTARGGELATADPAFRPTEPLFHFAPFARWKPAIEQVDSRRFWVVQG